MGYAALYHNTTGSNNSAQGFYALQNNTVGSNNIAIGQLAGDNITSGGSNIDIGSRVSPATLARSVSAIQTAQSSAYIAGVSSAKVTGSAVYVTSTGQLGVMASSERYKTAIKPMGSASEKLQQLRPVTFRLKSDRYGVTQFGLIAEEVAKVYPELVIRDGAGKIEGVRYEELAPMLLNVVQQQQLRLTDQARQLLQLQNERQEMAIEKSQLRDVKEQLAQLQVALASLQTKDARVAQR